MRNLSYIQCEAAHFPGYFDSLRMTAWVTIALFYSELNDLLKMVTPQSIVLGQEA